MDHEIKPKEKEEGRGTTEDVPSDKTLEEAPKEELYSYELAMKLLEGTKFSTLDHLPCKTSEESAKARGVSLASGAKAMLLRDK